MEPMTRSELFMATAAGEYSGELPEPVTRSEFYWQKIAQRIDAGGSVSPESIDAAIEDYINTHDADIVTEAELSNALAGKQAVLTAGENITIVDNNGNLTISATDTTYSAATTSTAGLMSATDKSKLDGIAAGAQVNAVTGVKGGNEAEYRTGNISITKGNVGLGNVDNTADADKPISAAAQTALDGKVDKITGKGLSEANFTDAEKTKLAGIAAGAEVNVQSDWNQGDDAADNYIRNKPANLVQDASYVHTDNNFSNAEKAKADGAIQSTEKGTANGVAELDANGKVPTSQLPAYVDDVLSYNSLSDFPVAGEDGKIYIAKDTNLSYRWGSSEYVVISPSLALGSTSSTAYRGDWGAEDRAAIGTLSTLNTTEKSNLVGAINELKTDSDTKQRTLTFDSAPTSGSTNPVTSGGVYTALASKQGTLTFDSSPTENSDNLVKSGVIYTALAGKAAASHTHAAMTGASSITSGTAGMVPAPTSGEQDKFLRGDGAWASFNVLPDLSAFSPNSFFRGKDLGIVNSSNMDAFITNHGISTGEFTDIYVGDYFTSPYNGEDTIFRIAGFDLYLYTGDTELTAHHIVVVPDYQLTTGAMNSTITTLYGYKGSNMFTNIIGGSAVTSGVNKNLYTTFGNHLLKYRELLSNTMLSEGKSKAVPTSSGIAGGWEWTDVYANLMSGSHIWGEASAASSIYDYGIPVGQFPLFRYESKYIINRSTSGSRDWYWLRNVANSSHFGICCNGNCSADAASYTRGVRPFLLLG